MSNSPTIKLEFICRFCTDIKEIYDFYTDILGLSTNMYSVEHGWLQFDFEGIHLVFTTGKNIEKHSSFAIQPGHDHGTLEVTSFSFKYLEHDFQKLWQRINGSKCEIIPKKPEWRVDSYWGLTILDPMGVSLELYYTPKTIPEDKVWK